MLAGRQQLDPRPLSEGVHPEVGESLVREAQLTQRRQVASLTESLKAWVDILAAEGNGRS